ncbi:MAG: hypothetical protein OXE77_06430 [Flavobacteriaceae bacterium]|nr:hypothetical protein [Flavobacteriaceae bacterium]MCY4267039.1 hypothetical protein [Flavobacteriaceae bacterium]MCY4299869.1 hypothetical protein [Flavobacteriaceae bacterium]
MSKRIVVLFCVFYTNLLFSQSGFQVTDIRVTEKSQTEDTIHNRFSAQGNFIGYDTIEFNLKVGYVNDMTQKEILRWINRSFDDIVKVIDDCGAHRLEELILEDVFVKLMGTTNRVAFYFKDGISYFVTYHQSNFYRAEGKCI